MNVPFAAIHPLAHLNASLNLLATVLLVIGYVLIRRGSLLWHKRVMLGAFGVSVAFLISYLGYHVQVGAKGAEFGGTGSIRTVYMVILVSHIVLAATVPFLAVATIWLALKGKFSTHKKLAKWTWPIWLYVSITGVAVYVLLYHVYPAPEVKSTMTTGLQRHSGENFLPPGR